MPKSKKRKENTARAKRGTAKSHMRGARHNDAAPSDGIDPGAGWDVDHRYARPLSGRVLDLEAMHEARDPRRYWDARNTSAESQMERYGHAVVGRDLGLVLMPPVIYTAGMSRLGHPEFLIDMVGGLNARLLPHLRNLCDDVVDGVEFQHGDVIEGLFPNGYRAMLLEMDDAAELEYATFVYGPARVRAFQVVIPDRQGLWPWEADAAAYQVQMLHRFRRNGLPRHLTGTRMAGFSTRAA